eukprot:334660_1
MSTRCLFQNNHVICSKHKSEVCGVCCSDYALFNKLRSNKRKESNMIQTEIKLYFKNPKRIVKASRNRVKAPELESLLSTVQSQQGTHYTVLVTLCGYMCFTARFFPHAQNRLQNLLQLALGANFDESDPPLESEIINQLKNEAKEYANHVKNHVKKRKQKRKAKMKQKQRKKQNKLKKRGIHTRIKNKKPSWNEQARNGEIDLSQNYASMCLLLTETGCKQLGSFFREWADCSIALDEANKEMNHWSKPTGGPDELIHLNDAQINTIQKSQKWMEFALKYGRSVPFDDPHKWDNQKLRQFLAENNITPKPMPPRDVLVKVVVELVDMKYKMMNTLSNMPEDDELQEIGKDVLDNNQRESMLSISDDHDDVLDTFNYVIDAQQIPSNPFVLPHWTFSVGKMFAIMRGASILGAEITTKPFKDMQESLVVIANSIDKYDCVEKIPMFMAQDREQTRGLSIIVTAVKDAHGVPVVVIKYFVGTRSMGSAGMRNMMAEMRKGVLMQEIPCDLVEVKLLTRLFQKNRKKMLDHVIQDSEKEWAKGWHLSAFIPYQKGEKKCPSCHKLATLRCSRCKTVAYCSRQCQKVDWKLHKKICKKPVS